MKKWIACLVLMLMLTGIVAAAPEQTGTTKEISLDEAVKLALTNNPSGKIAVFDFEAAKGALTAARSYRWFTISASHKDARTWSGEAANTAAGRDPNYVAEQYTNSATLNWTLWSGNRVESQVSQAKLSLDSSQWGIAKARQQLK